MDRNRPQVRGSRKLPTMVHELIRELDRQYPEPRLDPTLTHEDIMFLAGQRSVVLGLKDALASAAEKDPTEYVPS